MENISFEQAVKKISCEDIRNTVNSRKNSSSFFYKIITSFILSVLVTLPSLNYFLIFPCFSFLCLSMILIKYLSLNRLFKIVNYNKFMFTIWQTGMIFFLTVFLYIKVDKYHIVPFIYVIFGYLCSYYLVRSKIVNFIKTEYPESSEKYHKKTDLLSPKTSKILKTFLSVIILGILFYRFNKWWLMNVNLNPENGSVFEYIIWGGILITLLIGLTLLPTLIFSPSSYVKGKLLEKYSEEFRKQYNYTKEEWYGK